jgi:hypothetical protein
MPKQGNTWFRAGWISRVAGRMRRAARWLCSQILPLAQREPRERRRVVAPRPNGGSVPRPKIDGLHASEPYNHPNSQPKKVVIDASPSGATKERNITGPLQKSIIGWIAKVVVRAARREKLYVYGRVATSEPPRGGTYNAFSRRAGHASISTLDVRAGRLQWGTAVHWRGYHKIEYTLEASLQQVRPRRLGGCYLPAGRLPPD